MPADSNPPPRAEVSQSSAGGAEAGGSQPGGDGLAIRDLRPGDHAAVAEIYSHWVRAGGVTMDTAIKTAGDVGRMVAAFDDRECILVLEQRGEVLGWGVVKRYSDRAGYRVACETSVYLRPGLERRGMGTRLKRVVIERCRAFGYHHLVAKVWADNRASIEYNQRLGYEVVGVQREVGHSLGEWRDVCILQLILDDVPPYRPELGWPRSL